ncbi:circadian-associated transcriptional repressor-like, partial [Aplochiton taeniatus]
MQSQGSTSTQPSFDSLSSSDSSLFSDSTEDDADVFLSARSPSVIIGGPGVGRGGGPRRLESPASRWTYNAFTDREEEEEEESERSASCEGPRLGVQGAERSGEQEKSPADLLFAKKCAELQGFVRPLLELLNGLKRGRFERGLTSFQQSVAIDRIQRIVGVLRRPNGGEKYLTILTQVEKMLKMWFPHVSPVMDPPPSSSSSSSS